MRPVAALLVLLALPACARFSPHGDRTDTTVAANPATTLDVAQAQLEHHGFRVTRAGDQVLQTVPKPLQRYQNDSTGAAAKGNQWFLRVEVEPATFTAGTRLRVYGFVVPRGATAAGGAQQVNAIPIVAADKQLYADVKAAAGWIADEANRKGPKQSGGQRPQ